MTSSTYSVREEWLNCAVHVVGIVASLVALPVLATAAHRTGDPWLLAGGLTFGLSALLMFSTSSLYHAAKNPATRLRLRRVDHAAIYLLIAGTYTPFTLGPLLGPWGWSLFAWVWTGAIGGILWKAVALGRAPIVSVLLYVGMGWSCLIAFRPLLERLPTGGIALLIAGGLCYTLGLVFFAWKSLRFHHFIWHLFVLAGSICHYFAIFHYVVPAPLRAAL